MGIASKHIVQTEQNIAAMFPFLSSNSTSSILAQLDSYRYPCNMSSFNFQIRKLDLVCLHIITLITASLDTYVL